MEIQTNGNNIEIHDLKIQPSLQRASSKKGSKDNFSQLLKASLEADPPPSKQPETDPVEYIVKSGDSLWKIGKKFSDKDPFQIAKENGLSNPNRILPGQKLLIYPSPAKPTPSLETDVVTASWYGAEHHNKITASGQRYNMYKNTLAHNTLPFGTKVRLVNPENGKVAEGVVNDRGPYIKGRDVDTSYALAKKLGFVRKGVTQLNIEIM
jgi:rare lipoprotein A